MASIQGVYLALFGRPADPIGLSFFNQATNNGQNLTAIGDLASTAEYQTRFSGQSNTQIITSIYQSLFNREPDLAGLLFFSNALATGTLNINNIAIAIFDGARGSDVTIRDLKVAAANAFTAQIDTVAEINGYSGTAAADSGRAFIATVTTTAPTADQVTAAVAAATASGNVGTTITLTANVDAPGAIAPSVNTLGTGGNDIINAVNGSVNTLTAADQVDGAGGTDTLNLLLDANGSLAPISGVKNVEIFNIRDLADGSTVDFGTVTGETQVWNDRGTGALTFANVGDGTTVGLRGDGATVLGNVAFEYATAANAVNIAISGGVGTTGALPTITNGGVSAQVSNPTVANISSTLGANSVGAIDLTETAGGAAAGIATLNVAATTNLTATLVTGDYNTGGAALTVSGAAASVNLGNAGVFKTIDASGLTAGGLTVGLSTVTTSFKGGTGNDIVTTAALAASVAASAINAGAGTADRLVVGATTDVDVAAEAGQYAGFEVLDVAGNTANAALFTNSTINAIRIAGGTVNNLSAAQAGAVTQYANGSSTIAISGAATVGQIDTVKLTADDGLTAVNTIALGTPVLASIEKLELTATDNITIAALTGATSLDSIKIAGAGTVGITSGAITPASNYVVDASAATGVQTLDFGGIVGTATTNALSIIGGTKGDAITTGGGAADLVNGKDGLDTITVTKDALSSGFATVQSEAIVTANADRIVGFVTAENKFDYNGVLANGTGVAPGISAAEVVTGATFAAGLADGAAANAIVYIATTDIAAGAGGTAIANLVGGFTQANADALITTLVGAGGALNGAIANLDSVLGATDAALVVLDNGVSSVALRITNTDTATVNTLTAAEVQLVGVFQGTAQLAAADFV